MVNLIMLFFVMLQAMVEEGEGCPPMFGQVWVRDPNSLLWAKAYLLLKEKKLYLSYKVSEFGFIIYEPNGGRVDGIWCFLTDLSFYSIHI